MENLIENMNFHNYFDNFDNIEHSNCNLIDMLVDKLQHKFVVVEHIVENIVDDMNLDNYCCYCLQQQLAKKKVFYLKKWFNLLVELVAYKNFHNLVDKVEYIDYFFDNLFHMMVDMQQNKFVVVEYIVEYMKVDKMMHNFVVEVVIVQQLVEIVEDMNFHNYFDMMKHMLVDYYKLFDMMVDKLFDKLNIVVYKMEYKLVDMQVDN